MKKEYIIIIILLVVVATLSFFVLYKPPGLSSATEASKIATDIGSSINRLTSTLADIDRSLGR